MSNPYFQFKQFTIHQDRCAMKVTTDACLFGAWVVQKIKTEGSKAENILDIGMGTALLSLMVAQQYDAMIDAIEKDKDAFEQANENICSSSWGNRIKIFYGDARKYSFPSRYNIIISNPPFYGSELKSDDAKRNIALHNDGLLLDELLDIIKKNLAPGGKFYLLLPYKRDNEIEKLFAQKNLAINHKLFARQSTNHDYFRIMIAGTHQQANETGFSTSEISIWNDRQQYTAEFTALLKDYYLHL
jgi:tRNA1Val (adenine37-N6)-methyltransferase